MSNSTAVTNQDVYKTVVSHYLSPKRKDDVKKQWEELFSREVIAHAIDKLKWKSSPESLRIIDFGCGIGGGWTQLQNALEHLDIDKTDVSYLGVDNSLEMVKVAQEKWEDTPNVDFQQVDFRHKIPEKPAEVYFSCGVPYSHLTPEETQTTLENIFKTIKQNQTQSVVVIDVLGRYSIEWTSQWEHRRWPYRMSFLADGEHEEPAMMTCYYAPELKQKIHAAINKAGCEVTSIEFFDRSIMVGRHTSTREYNSSIPPYRELINNLYKSDTTTDFQELLFQSEVSESSPALVQQFFQDFSQKWDCLVAEAAEFCGETLEVEASVELPEPIAGLKQKLSHLQEKASDSENFRASVVEPTLAEYLRALESKMQPGLGVSHTLIAVIYVNGDQNN